MFPIPAPAPAAPAPIPRASAIALPACTTGASFTLAAMSCKSIWDLLLWLAGVLLVFRLDRRADVDRRENGEDECLNRDDDHHLEDVEDRRDADERDREVALEDEDQ